MKNAKDDLIFMFGDFFLNFWPQLVLRRTNYDKAMKKGKTYDQNLRRIWQGHSRLNNLTRRYPLPFGSGGGLIASRSPPGLAHNYNIC